MVAVQLLLVASMGSIQRSVKLLRLSMTTKNPRLRYATELFGSFAHRSRRITAEIAAATQLWRVDLDFLCCHTSRLTSARSYIRHLFVATINRSFDWHLSPDRWPVSHRRSHPRPHMPCPLCLSRRRSRRVAAARVPRRQWKRAPQKDSPHRSHRTCRTAASPELTRSRPSWR